MSRSLRVLYVNHVSELGGAERSLLVLLSALDRAEVQPLLAAPPGPLADEAERLGVDVRRIRFGRVRWRGSVSAALKSLGRIVGAAQRLRPLLRQADLVHANSTAAALAVALARWPGRRPFVWHVRDLRFPPLLVRLVGQRADAVIAISAAVKRQLEREGLLLRNITVLANALAPGETAPIPTLKRGAGITKPAPRAGLGSPASGFNRWPAGARPVMLAPMAPNPVCVAVVAQLVPWKGHDVLLEAFARVAPRHPGARLLVIGSDLFGEHPEWVAALHERSEQPDLAGRVLWLGQRDDVPDLLAASDILVLPSHGEPFGRVLLEAMAAGRPVIATAAGGTPEVVCHGVTGLLVPDWDVEALAGAMDRLLSLTPDRRARMGDAGRALLERGFRPSSHAAAVTALYRTLQGR